MITPPTLLTTLRAWKMRKSYQQLSRELDLPIPTIARWLKSGRINPLYARELETRLRALNGGESQQ